MKPSSSYQIFDGPIYSNGNLHQGHLLNKSLKNFITRYYHQKFIMGFDMGGLPNEKVARKNRFLEPGSKKYLEMCKLSVEVNIDQILETSKRIGFQIDGTYGTLYKDYYQGTWNILAKVYQEGFLLNNLRPYIYCPQCTDIVTQSDLQIVERSVSTYYIGVPLREEGKYLLFWTTTLWSVPLNDFFAYNPQLSYHQFKNPLGTFIFAKETLELVEEALKTTFEDLGSVNLENLQFDTFFNRNVHIIPAEFVTRDVGTGVVHVATGSSQVDFKVAKDLNLPIRKKISFSGRYLDNKFNGITGLKIMSQEANRLIEANLSFFQVSTLKRPTATCKCSSETYTEVDSGWYINLSNLNEKMKEITNSISWFPDSIQRRQLNWVAQSTFWEISRRRSWGTPLPIWTCSVCNNNRFIVPQIPEEIDITTLNSWLNNVQLACDNGCGYMKREPFILDCWLEACLGPFIYNIKNATLVEGQDQTRGYFFGIIALSACLNIPSPVTNILTTGWVTTKEGKLSKSKGDEFDLERFLVDTPYNIDDLRNCFLYSRPATDFKFTTEVLDKAFKLRYLIKSLMNFETSHKFSDITDLEIYLLQKASSVNQLVNEHISSFRFLEAITLFEDFLRNFVSRNYCNLIKEYRTHSWPVISGIFSIFNNFLQALFLDYVPLTSNTVPFKDLPNLSLLWEIVEKVYLLKLENNLKKSSFIEKIVIKGPLWMNEYKELLNSKILAYTFEIVEGIEEEVTIVETNLDTTSLEVMFLQELRLLKKTLSVERYVRGFVPTDILSLNIVYTRPMSNSLEILFFEFIKKYNLHLYEEDEEEDKTKVILQTSYFKFIF